MSHFTVVVFGDDIQAALAPYQENNCGTCPKKYLEFHNVEPEYQDQFANDTTERVKMPDGSFKTTWDEEFRISGKIGTGGDTHQVPDHLEKVQVPLKDLYEDFDAFMADWAGYTKDKEKGVYGYWENPNAKWDWYQIGGRWMGYFPLTEGKEAAALPQSEDTIKEYKEQAFLGEASWASPESDKQSADSLLIKDIDFYRADKEAADQANKVFDWWEEINEGEEPAKGWTHFYSLSQDESEDYDLEKARADYNNQPVIKKSRKPSFIFSCPVESVGYDREAYVKRSVNGNLVPYAFISQEGTWVAQGEMGWWGMSSGDKDAEVWIDQYQNYIRSLPPETRATVVDCHI
jgi:hypothetical protein